MAHSVLFRSTPLRPALRRGPIWHWGTEIDHLFEGLWNPPRTRRGTTDYTPRIDLVETPSEIRVSAELPGLDAEEVQLEFEDGILRIHGEKTAVDTDEEVSWHRAERSYGHFERAIRVPVEVDADAAKAHYRDGVLSVTMPKSASAQVREIPVEAAAS